MSYELHFTLGAPGPFPPQRREPGRNGAPDSPIRADFPDGPEGGRAYVVAWHAWLRMIADGTLTRAERAVRAQLYAQLFDVPANVAEMLTLTQLRMVATYDPDTRRTVLDALRQAAD